MVRGPRIFAVVEEPAAQAIPVLHWWHVIARFHDDHAHVALVGEFLRHHRGRDPGADDADVGLNHARCHSPPSPVPRPASGSGWRGAYTSGRHWFFPMRDW